MMWDAIDASNAAALLLYVCLMGACGGLLAVWLYVLFGGRR